MSACVDVPVLRPPNPRLVLTAHLCRALPGTARRSTAAVVRRAAPTVGPLRLSGNWHRS